MAGFDLKEGRYEARNASDDEPVSYTHLGT